MAELESKKLTILVADDSLTYRCGIQELLEDNGYHVVTAVDGKEALAVWQQEKPVLAILDVIMPELDGVEVCQAIKRQENRQYTSVLMLTSKDDVEDKVLGLDAGADEYITKPFNEDELLAKVASLLRFHSLQGELGFSYEQKSVVLVADDSLTVRMQLSELLDDDGYKPILVEDGVEALSTVCDVLPDLVILDVVMPGMNGIEVCRRLKQNPATQQIPVVIITSKNDVDDKIRGLEAGADDYLFKPYNPKEFSAKINAIFRMKKRQVEAERNILARSNVELQQVNDKLKQTQAQLVQNEKMVALGQLVAGVAHEINNPLSYVINNSRLCGETMKDLFELIDEYGQLVRKTASEQQIAAIEEIEEDIDLAFLQRMMPKYYGDINEGLARIRSIVIDLRNFSRLDEAELKLGDINDCLDSTINLINHQLRGNIKLERQYSKHSMIFCHPSKLNQVFLNILVNCIHAMEGVEGSIIVRTEEVDNTWLQIQIIDQGKGMDQYTLAHLFEPFYTTKAVGTGTGLGLSISYSIIEQHEGEILFTSEVNIGTTCTIRLPMNHSTQLSDNTQEAKS